MSSPERPEGRPGARYGARRAGAPRGLSGRIVAVLLVLLVALAVVVVARYIMQRTDVPISAEMTDYEQVDDHELLMRIDVTRKDTSRDSYCIVRALDVDMREVGRRDVIIPAGEAELTRWSVPIATRHAAVSGGVYGCAVDLPHHLRP